MDDHKADKVKNWPTDALKLLAKHGSCDQTNYRDHHAGRCDCGWSRDGAVQRGWAYYISEELAKRARDEQGNRRSFAADNGDA